MLDEAPLGPRPGRIHAVVQRNQAAEPLEREALELVMGHNGQRVYSDGACARRRACRKHPI